MSVDDAAGGPPDAGDDAAVVRGLASLALSAAERGATEDEARVDLIRVLRAHGTADPAVVSRAADAVQALVEPEDDGFDVDEPDDPDDVGMDPEDAVRVRAALGVVPVEDRLTAALTSREWLQRFAADLAR